MYYNINHSAGKIKLKNELNVLKLFFFFTLFDCYLCVYLHQSKMIKVEA